MQASETRIPVRNLPPRTCPCARRRAQRSGFEHSHDVRRGESRSPDRAQWTHERNRARRSPDVKATPGSTMRCVQYKGCMRGYPVVFCTTEVSVTAARGVGAVDLRVPAFLDVAVASGRTVDFRSRRGWVKAGLLWQNGSSSVLGFSGNGPVAARKNA